MIIFAMFVGVVFGFMLHLALMPHMYRMAFSRGWDSGFYARGIIQQGPEQIMIYKDELQKQLEELQSKGG